MYLKIIIVFSSQSKWSSRGTISGTSGFPHWRRPSTNVGGLRYIGVPALSFPGCTIGFLVPRFLVPETAWESSSPTCYKVVIEGISTRKQKRIADVQCQSLYGKTVIRVKPVDIIADLSQEDDIVKIFKVKHPGN